MSGSCERIITLPGKRERSSPVCTNGYAQCVGTVNPFVFTVNISIPPTVRSRPNGVGICVARCGQLIRMHRQRCGRVRRWQERGRPGIGSTPSAVPREVNRVLRRSDPAVVALVLRDTPGRAEWRGRRTLPVGGGSARRPRPATAGGAARTTSATPAASSPVAGEVRDGCPAGARRVSGADGGGRVGCQAETAPAAVGAGDLP